MDHEKEQIIYSSEGISALIKKHKPKNDFQIPEKIEGFEKNDGDFGSVIFSYRGDKTMLVEVTLNHGVFFFWDAYLVGPNIRLVPQLDCDRYVSRGIVPEEKNLKTILMKLFGVEPIEIKIPEPVVQMPVVPWQPKRRNNSPYFCFASEAEEMFKLFDREKEKIEKQIAEAKK